MATLIGYKLLADATLPGLEAKINTQIALGWQPTGDIVVSEQHRQYYQAMSDDGVGIGHSKKVISNGDAMTAVIDDLSPLLYGDGTVSVVDGVAKLILGNTASIVADSQTLVVPVTGVYSTSVTFTVVNGVITGIVLS
jgi:hypothetical protein